MHILIGFAIIVGLVAFAFGNDMAARFVRTVLVTIGLALIALLSYVVITALHDDATESAKIPEETAELYRACDEWLTHPDDAPRMCFAVLDRAGGQK